MSTCITGKTGQVGRCISLPNTCATSGDLTQDQGLSNFFKEFDVDTIIHLAAKVGGIRANKQAPLNFLKTNMLIDMNVVQAAFDAGVPRLLGMLSTCAFPASSPTYPMVEADLFDGPVPADNSGYANAKRLLAYTLDTYKAQYGVNYSYLIPCNLYSAVPNKGNDNHFVTDLIYRLIQYQKDKQPIRFIGTGSALRQFMYAKDLVRAIELWLKSNDTENYIIATPEVLSVYEMALIGARAVGVPRTAIEFDGNVSWDGQYRKDCTSQKFIEKYPDFKFTPFELGFKEAYDQTCREYNR